MSVDWLSPMALALDYERRADAELDAASTAASEAARDAHLDQAAVYAHLSERSRLNAL